MPGPLSDDREVEELSASECWRLIESGGIGRLAVTHVDGGPDIFPLNYVAHQGKLYVRSGAGRKLRSVRDHPAVALEVDGEEEGFYWSVVVRGSAALTEVDSEILASGARHLISDDPEHKPHVVRIQPATVTGRRFARRSPADAGRPVPRSIPHRADAPGRPKPIPHFPPAWER